MDEQLRKEIETLGETAWGLEGTFHGTRMQYSGQSSGDGHSFDDTPLYDEVPVYNYKYMYSEKERKQAKKELRKIRKNSLDEEVRILAEENLGPSKMHLIGKIIQYHPCAFSFALIIGLVKARDLVFYLCEHFTK